MYILKNSTVVHDYFALVELPSIVMIMPVYVCLSVCLSVSVLFTKCFVHVARSRDSVLLRRRCDMLRTSGFMDDVMFSYHGTG